MKTRQTKPTKKDSFKLLQKHYDLETPEQIKLRIIWKHLCELTVGIFGDRPENIARLNIFKEHWRVTELQENRNNK